MKKIIRLFLCTLCAIISVSCTKQTCFPVDDNGFPLHDVVMINGVQYDVDFNERSTIIEVDADETLEIILPRPSLSCVWDTRYENAVLDAYQRIEMDSDDSIIGISNVVDRYVFQISEETNFIHFICTNEASDSSLFQLNIHING